MDPTYKMKHTVMSDFYTAAILVLIFLCTHKQPWWMVQHKKEQFISIMMQCRQLLFEAIKMKGYHENLESSNLKTSKISII